MLDALSCIFRLNPGDGASVATLLGTLPSELEASSLPSPEPGQPAFHRLGEKLLVLASQGQSQLFGYVFDEVPPATELPRLARQLAKLTQQTASSSVLPPHAEVSSASDLLASYIAKSEQRLTVPKLFALSCDAIVNAGLAKNAALMLFKPGGETTLALSTLEMETARDQIADIFRRWRGEAFVSETVKAGPLQAQEDLRHEDTLLLLDKLGAAESHLSLPARGEAGFAIALFDPASPDPKADCKRLRAILELKHKTRRDWSRRKLWFQRGLIGTAAIAGVFLMLPTDRMITGSGVAQAKDVEIVSVHFPTYLDRMNVSVGEQVDAGAPLATLSAPEQDDLRAETLFQISAEQASATAALADDDYGAYVLAQSRVSLQQTRLAQIDARLALLEPEASTHGRIISALSGGETGRYLPPGTEIAQIQTSSEYRFEFTVSATDASLIEVGQAGQLSLRGQLGEVYPIRVTTAPTPVDAGGEAGAPPVLVASAIIEGDVAREILPGLSGYAQVDTGRDLRIRVWTRHVAEYIRMQAWIHLNWRI